MSDPSSPKVAQPTERMTAEPHRYWKQRTAVAEASLAAIYREVEALLRVTEHHSTSAIAWGETILRIKQLCDKSIVMDLLANCPKDILASRRKAEALLSREDVKKALEEK